MLLPSPSITDPEFAKGGVGSTHRVMEQPNTSRDTLQRMPTAAPLTYTGIGGHALPQSKPRHSDREASSFSQRREKENQATTISRAPWHCPAIATRDQPLCTHGCFACPETMQPFICQLQPSVLLPDLFLSYLKIKTKKPQRGFAHIQIILS